MTLTTTLAERVLEQLLNTGDIDRCEEYGEPGYDLEEGKKAILFADWNPFDKYPNFMEWIEDNYEIEWSDEWMIDHNTGKAYRCVADSYGWEQQFRITEDGELITPDDDVSEWIDHCKIDDRTMLHTPSALPSFISQEDIEAEGFELINDDLQNGWYDRVDDPKQIVDEYLGEYKEIVFSLNGVGQFSVDFAAYGRR